MQVVRQVLVSAPVACMLALASPAGADEFPKLKPGQWEMTTLSANAAGAPPIKTTICTDEALQKEIFAMGTGMSRDMCSKTDVKREGARIVTSAECKVGESNLKSRAVMTLAGDTGYRTEITATYDPPFMNMRDAKTTLVGKNVGACRDGLVPGDVVTANGRKFNIKGIADRKPPLAPLVPPPQSK